MKSSHKAKDAKIFKYHDFAEEAPEMLREDDLLSPHEPYLVFEDEGIKIEKEDEEQQGITGSSPYLTFGDEIVKLGTEAPVITEVPYLTFGDEDFNFKKGDPAVKEATTEPEEAEESAEPEQKLRIEDYKEPSMTMAEKIINDAELEAKDIVEKCGRNAENIIDKANKDAKNIIDEANEKAKNIVAEAEESSKKLFADTKEEAYKEGYEQGLSEGNQTGKEQALRTTEEKHRAFFARIDEACKNIEIQKEEAFQQHLKDLTDLALAISEKIICVALDSCGEVAKRMILSAVAEAAEKQWAKITISAKDAKIMEDEGINIGNELYSVSDRIDLIIIDDAAPGTCLIEFPDQAIDAGADAQLRNIRAALYEAD